MTGDAATVSTLLANAGFELTDKPAFSVQYHPEASSGPQHCFHLFEKFVGML